VRIRLAAVVLAFACFTGVAYADGPGPVYNDFAQDGKLSCNHSRSALHAVLRSGSINQYGDPFTLARLKLAVRRQLAGGCSPRSSASGSQAQSQGGGTTTGGQATGGRGNAGHRPNHGTKVRHPQQGVPGGSASESAASAISTGGDSGFIWSRALIAALVVGGVAVGGWLTRRGLAARH
jgi:cobalamin biosynthesis Mg chelatase CobN